MATVPGLGEYLKMNEFLYLAFSSRETVAAKSSSDSVGNPTMKSPEIMRGRPSSGLSRCARARSRNSRYSPTL
ncbi:MAG: hypothetical protein DYG92_10560 [Leptolyngbya sp. PLA1]|nr:hypothetical protein [Leptolyngbya sp. PLA1]